VTTEEKQARLEQINQILTLGVSSESSDGQSTAYNHDTLRAERSRLERELGVNEMPRLFRFNRTG
jgi:uncharacterized protein YoaH (UPF0181 family)